jgi:putative hydrolase of the HAD superfamily
MSEEWDAVRAVLLDAGNTLVSIDFDWLARLLAAEGVKATVDGLSRAEASARPVLSRRLAGPATERRLSTESGATFSFYVSRILAGLPGLSGEQAEALAPRLAGALKSEGNPRLWSRVLPGTRGALDELRELGLRLAVVSNSDGTIRETLERLDLAGHFEAIFDSRLVGFEKPDSRIFARALEALGCEPSSALYVGDLYSVDVVGARAAGLEAALVDPFGDWRGVDCALVADLAELARRLRARGGSGAAGHG